MNLDAYNAACENAQTELMQLSKRFYELTARREQLSRLRDILEALLSSDPENAKRHQASTISTVEER